VNSFVRLGYSSVAIIILNILLALEVADKMIAKDELEVAREIQMSLMPRIAPPDMPGDVACFSEPAREVGGDYYDFICPRPQRGTYIIIGDVKGKGMAAALYMVRVQALLQYIIQTYHQPSEILIELNKNIRKLMRADFFISLSITLVDSSGGFSLARAGHMPLIYYSARTSKLRMIEPPGIAVGLENGGRFESAIEESQLRPQSGDVLVYYTDGVIETMDHEQNQYGELSLNKIIRENVHLTAGGIKDAILTDLARFRGNTPPQDDLTFIIVKMP